MNDGDERSSLITRISEVQRDLVRLFADPRSLPMFDSNLTMRQLKVIMILAFHDSQSGQDLARGLGVGLATVTGIIDRLVAQRLVERHEDPTDRRVRRVRLTDAGRRLVDQFLNAGMGHYQALMEFLDTETLRDLEHIVHKLHAAAIEFCASRAGDAIQPPEPGPDPAPPHLPTAPPHPASAAEDAPATQARHPDPAPDPAR